MHGATDTPVPANARGFERYRGMIVRIAGLLAVIVVIVWAVWYFVDAGPEEKYRVAAPAGYSVIRPSDWRADVIPTTDSDGFVDSIVMGPEQWRGLQPMMWVKRYGAPPDFDKLQRLGFHQENFLGQTAWMTQVKPKRHLVRTVIFERNGSWFNAGVSLPDLEATKVDKWWPYIASFRADKLSSRNKPTTATAPENSL
jgi:hypothetical protein